MTAKRAMADLSALSPALTEAAAESWPVYAADEIAAATAVLASGKVNQWTGANVGAFEQAFKTHFGMPHAVAVVNGTVALELALKALGIGAGDEVIVSPRSFVASAACVVTVGATPIFADVDPVSGNISAATVAPHIGPRTRAILPVHLGGWPCDMPALMALAKDHGLLVVEDCAQSHGALVDGRPAGAFGDAAAFSFCQDKIISTGGEGGMVLYRDDHAYRRAWSYKDHGKDYDLMRRPPERPGYRYVHTSIGTNWRMLELQAAIGLVQLGKLEGWVAARSARARIWRGALSALDGVSVATPGNRFRHAYYKLYARIDPNRLRPGKTRDGVLAALLTGGVRAFSGSCSEIYREAAFQVAAVPTRPNAAALGASSLMFEVHPTLDTVRLTATAARAAGIIADFLR